MRRLALGFWCLVIAALGFAAGAQAAARPYVVVFRDGVSRTDAEVSRLEARYGFDARYRYRSALKGFAARLTDSERSGVARDAEVAYVGPDVTVRASGMVPVAPGETVPPGVRRIGAATLTNAHERANGAVAVLDTGVDLANPDLDAVSGKNCVNTGAPAKDDNGHGTNVAGILAARNSGATLTGTAPGTRIYSVKVLGSKATGTLSQIICGIDWVTANAAALNIRVANMSVEGAGSNDGNCGLTKSDAWHEAICRSTAAGVTYVASAGNSKTNLAKTVPAAYPEVLTATAMSDTDGAPGGKGGAPKCKAGERDDSYATYSNYAVASVDIAHTIAAPGTCVVGDRIGGGTTTYYGTSQAAPHVAGVLALCLGNGGAPGPCDGLAPAQQIARIRSDAAAAASLASGFAGDPLRPVSGKYFGYLVSAAIY